MKVYQYYLNYRGTRDPNPEWMGVAHTQDIQASWAQSKGALVTIEIPNNS